MRDEQIRRLLRYSDVLLSEPETALMTLFSGFRGPATAPTLAALLESAQAQAISPLRTLDAEAFNALVVRLESTNLLHHDLRTDTYTPHPLARAHFLSQISRRVDEASEIESYYRALARALPQLATPDELRPFIEGPDENHGGDRPRSTGFSIQSTGFAGLEHPDTDLLMLKTFFPEGDITRDPAIDDPHRRAWVLNEVGLRLLSAGQLHQAVPYFERVSLLMLEEKDWHNACVGTQNLVNVYHHMGDLELGAVAAGEALELARHAQNIQDERDALLYGAWAAHLYGDAEMAGAAFERATAMQTELDSKTPTLYGMWGLYYGEHLRRLGKLGESRRIAANNLNDWAIPYGRLQDESRCHRLLGDLDAAVGRHSSARAHYDKALWIAQGITYQPALIEALLSRGRWVARQRIIPELENARTLKTAMSDLEEALGYATQSHYNLYEADARVARAWAYLSTGESTNARQEAERAQALSAQMGYHWGQKDADEVLRIIDASEQAWEPRVRSTTVNA